MTPARILDFNRRLSQPNPDDTPPLTEELDYLADKLAKQQALNASLMCEVKRLQSELKKLRRFVASLSINVQ